MKTENAVIIMKALADESRLKIVNSLIEKPQYVEEISRRIGLAESTVSFHLKKLELAGLAFKRKEQYYFIYSINPDVFDIPLGQLISTAHGNLNEQKSRMHDYRKKVLSAFVKNGKLIKIPAQNKKRLIILEHLAMRFSYGTEYQEREVNEIILAFYEDYCTLRRLMIEEGIFSRKENKYRKVIRNEETERPGNKNVVILKVNGKKIMDRKQIIKDYKSTMTPMGIFQLKNNISGRIYLGSSKNLNSSKNRHTFQLSLKGHSNPELQAEWNELGEDAFTFEVIDRLEPKEDISYNYDEDLKTLFELWKEKLTESGKDVRLIVKHCKM